MTSIDHQARAHAVLSASGFKKWSTCTMAPAIEEQFEEEDSEWSKEGTFGHELGEARLRVWLSGNDGPDIEAVQALEASEDAQKWLTDEFDAHVNTYVNFVIDAVTGCIEAHGRQNVVVLLEQRLDFSPWVPEGFGTGDCVIVYPGGVWVIDLKMGAGVRVTDTGQLRLYGLGALHRYDLLYDVQNLTVTIVQPRMDNIRTETASRQELLDWADELVVPRAKIAWAAYSGDRSQARFSPGRHCHEGFCKARFTCAARARANLEAAELPFAKDAPDVLTDEQLEAIVDKARPAVKWLADCERYLTDRVVSGKAKLQHHEIRPGRSNRTIVDVAKAAETLMCHGFAAADIYKAPALRGITELEQLVGKAQFKELLGPYVEKPEGKPSIVPKSEPRPVRKGSAKKAQDDFDEFED